MDNSESTSVSISWEPVEDADYYIVSLSSAVGVYQEGLCTDDSHSANVTVHVPMASIPLAETDSQTTSLRAYTTYSVTVIRFSDVWGRTEGSHRVIFTTHQMGMCKTQRRCSTSSEFPV